MQFDIRHSQFDTVMTDEEFERIKEAEKERLRMQKRLRSALESLKRRNEVQSVVRRMSQGAKRLLEETEALADKLASTAARQAARLEVAMDEEEEASSLAEDEEVLREERASAVLRRMKAEEEPRATGGSARPSVDENQSETAVESEESDADRPEKTIGRMGSFDTDE